MKGRRRRRAKSRTVRNEYRSAPVERKLCGRTATLSSIRCRWQAVPHAQARIPSGRHRVYYTLEGYPDVKQVQFRTENEITPDYFTMLDHGKQCLEAETRGAVTTVTNSRSMCKVEVSASGPESAAIRCVDEPGFLSWLCVAEIEADLADGLPLHWVLSLRST